MFLCAAETLVGGFFIALGVVYGASIWCADTDMRCAAAGCCGLGRFVGGVRASRLSCALKRIVARASDLLIRLEVRRCLHIYSVLEVAVFCVEDANDDDHIKRGDDIGNGV